MASSCCTKATTRSTNSPPEQAGMKKTAIATVITAALIKTMPVALAEITVTAVAAAVVEVVAGVAEVAAVAITNGGNVRSDER